MRISDWSSDVCSSDLAEVVVGLVPLQGHAVEGVAVAVVDDGAVVLLVAGHQPSEHGVGGDHTAVGPPAVVELVYRELGVALPEHGELDHRVGAPHIRYPAFPPRP